MFFRKKDSNLDNKYYTIFANYYNKIIALCKQSDFCFNAEFEILPAMFVIGDFSALSSKKDRASVAKGMMSFIDRVLKTSAEKTIFEKRNMLYGEIIRGKSLRADWYLGDVTPLYQDPITKCGTVLGDILINPDCADDYDYAPAMIMGAFETMSFAQSTMFPVLSELVNFFKDIYDV